MNFLSDPSIRTFLFSVLLLFAWICAPLWYRFVRSHLIERFAFTKSSILLRLASVLYYGVWLMILGFLFLTTWLLTEWAGVAISIPVFLVTFLVFKGYVYKQARPSKIEKISVLIAFVVDAIVLTGVGLLLLRIFG